MPKRLKIVFSNSLVDDRFNFAYVHECENDSALNIFEEDTFKIKMDSIPLAFEDVTYHKSITPRPGTSLQDNFILEGRIFGIYEETTDCSFDVNGSSRKNVAQYWQWTNPSKGEMSEYAMADRYRIFYRRGSIENVMMKDKDGVRDYLTLLRNYADDSGCEGCYGWKWFGCLADWTSAIPEGFSCAKAIPAIQDGCKEVFEQVDCSDLVVKVTSDKCEDQYSSKSCPDAFMKNETLKVDNCLEEEVEEQGEYGGVTFRKTGNWLTRHTSIEDYTCCRNSSDCCQDCFAYANLGT